MNNILSEIRTVYAKEAGDTDLLDQTIARWIEWQLTDQDIAAWHEARATRHVSKLARQVGAFQIWGSRDEGNEPLRVVYPA